MYRQNFTRASAVWLVTAGLLAAGKGNLLAQTGAVVCDLVARPAVRVTVIDSVTGSPVMHGTRVRIRDGAFADSITTPADTTIAYWHGILFGTATERPGRYSVTVSHQGYADWSVSGVRVTKNACGVIPVLVVARLVRSSR
jgi:hypothetical protein